MFVTTLIIFKQNFVNKILKLGLVVVLWRGGITIKNLDFANNLNMEDVMEIKIILKHKTNAKKYANLKNHHNKVCNILKYKTK